MLAAVQPFRDLGDFQFIDALKNVQAHIRARQTAHLHIIRVLNRVPDRCECMATVDDAMSAWVGKGDFELATASGGTRKFGILNQEINPLIFDRHIVRVFS